MTNVSIGNFTFQDGDVERVVASKNSNIDATPMPLSDSTDTMIFDFDGVQGNISITGGITDATTTRVSGQTITTIAQQITYLKSLVNGNQSDVAFTSNYYSCRVMVSKVEFTEEAGNPNKIAFSIDLVEGSGI